MEDEYKFEVPGDEEFAGIKLLALYFSAWNCPPSRIFTNALKEFYDEVNIDKKVIEIFYVSWDQSEDEYKNNLALMPWAALKFTDPRVKHFRSKYAVKFIPYLIVLDPLNEFEVISIRGRKEVQDQPKEWLQLWLDRQFEQRYTDPVPDLPVSITTTDEAKEAIAKHAEWEAERKREKELEDKDKDDSKA